MGMYTELVLKSSVKETLPDDVNAVLSYLFNRDAGDVNGPEATPKHEFFQCPRWRMIGTCSSYYHIPWSASAYRNGYIFSRSDLKNYDEEIQKFIDWVMPYLDAFVGGCIGWMWYEEDDEPTLLYKTD